MQQLSEAAAPHQVPLTPALVSLLGLLDQPVVAYAKTHWSVKWTEPLLPLPAPLAPAATTLASVVDCPAGKQLMLPGLQCLAQ